MKPVYFKQVNSVAGSNQEEYIPLPCWRQVEKPYVPVTSCWRLTWKERLKLLFAGRIYLTLLTFGNPLQPLFMSTRYNEHLN